MTTDAAALPGAGNRMRSGGGGEKSREYRAIAVVSAAHFVNHFQNLVLPPLFPFLTGDARHRLCRARLRADHRQHRLGRGAIAGRVSRRPLGSRRMLVLGLVDQRGGLYRLRPVADLSASADRDGAARPCQQRLSSRPIMRSFRRRSPPARVGRAFSIHTFSGFLGNADRAGDDAAAGRWRSGSRPRSSPPAAIALVAALPLLLVRGVDNRLPAARAGCSRRRRGSGSPRS